VILSALLELGEFWPCPWDLNTGQLGLEMREGWHWWILIVLMQWLSPGAAVEWSKRVMSRMASVGGRDFFLTYQ